jgi:hypothetical protein
VPWLAAAPVELRGSMLGRAGLEVPSLFPEQLLLIHLESVGAAASQPSSRKMDYT